MTGETKPAPRRRSTSKNGKRAATSTTTSSASSAKSENSTDGFFSPSTPVITTKRFEGKVVIITGSSAGIGRQAAIEFAQEGASVTIHGQSEQRLKDAQKAIQDAGIPTERILAVRGPIQEEETQRAIVEKTVERFGRIDALINNAGIMKPESLGMDDMDAIECYDYIFAVNVRRHDQNIIQLTKVAAPHLEKTKGCVINVSSIAAQRHTAVWPYYSMSKAALNHYSKDAAIKYASMGIRVNIISPGPISTEFLSRHVSQETTDAMASAFAKKTLMKRFGVPHEVTAMMRTLCSDEASYITGAELIIDGGSLISPV